MKISELRAEYHKDLCKKVFRIRKTKSDSYPNIADSGSKSSKAIAWGIVKKLGCEENFDKLDGQTAGNLFEKVTKSFIERAFTKLNHLRPGNWEYNVESTISGFEQYRHLEYLEHVIGEDKTLSSAFGKSYIVKPDIVISRKTVSDTEINKIEKILGEADTTARLTPFRRSNQEDITPILHASISCKYTIRSDRAQNTRTEALNLIRNRKGQLPHIMAVTAEPLPGRIAALALGTGDLDCVYHFALDELKEAIVDISNEDQLEMLDMMIEGKRLRDISDLPFDLAS